MTDFDALRAPIPRDKVHWRAQTLTNAGDKALALAYIDARDLMDRLDDACGPDGWQDSYEETPKGRVLCTIAIRTSEGEWVSKCDGAGATDVEGDKGGISDAFKRAGVKWGVGRELYDIGNVWVPCELNGKGKWKRWTDDPWGYVRGKPAAPAKKPPQNNHSSEREAAANAEREAKTEGLTVALIGQIEGLAPDGVGALLQEHQTQIAWIEKHFPAHFKRIEAAAAKAGAPMREAS